ncbi:rhodanese-related sulfurtransferase [Candidatus Pelagibacter sp.]|nr:rhodanese-related sulfurtransferase [Candidatus Pelagibacter sp.]MDC3135924.1 rhodanese-related sulfurtransferase [Candidatus Pelagibacter sp.]
MFTVFGFYKFQSTKNLRKYQKLLVNLLNSKNINGSIIISKEGLNGSISGINKDIKATILKLKEILNIKEFDSFNYSKSIFKPFHKPKIKIKNEVVPMNLKMSNRIKQKNSHIEPKNWNQLIKKKKTLLLDARKPFEHKVGSFKKSINPNISNFRDFPKYLEKLKKNQPIAMFCTGGIRCEKATVYLKKKGFKSIYQLKGGILNYLKKIKPNKSLWQGECFVFDNRVSLKHGLTQGTYSICGGCRQPISFKDKKSKRYEEGVTCPNCFGKLSNSQKSRFRMRQSQIYKAKQSEKKYIFQKEFN